MGYTRNQSFEALSIFFHQGLDIKSVDLVINYSVPWPSDYVHRIGRAGRSTVKGNCVVIMVPRDVPFLKKIEDYIGEKLIALTLKG